MPEAPYDLKANHPLLPHPKVTELFKENEFRYDKKIADTNYENWYAEVKKSKITIQIYQMYRLRRLIENIPTDFIFYDAMLYGTDRKGNKAPIDVRLGLYQKPTFRKQIDDRTDKIISHEIQNWDTVYEYKYTTEIFDDLLLKSTEDDLKLNVITPGRIYTIPDIQDFRDGSYQELAEIGRTGKSLDNIRKEKITLSAPTPAATTKKDK
jgi:hypothetical protein